MAPDNNGQAKQQGIYTETKQAMTDLINSIQKSIDYDNYLLALLNELKPDDQLTYLPIIQDSIESNTQLIKQLNETVNTNTDRTA